MAKKYYSKKHKVNKGKKNKILIFVYSFLSILLLVAIAYFTRYDNFEFKTIEISGVEGQYEEEMREVVEESLSSTSFLWLVSRGTPMTYKKSEIKETLLRDFPKIERLIIKSKRNGILNIIVSERGPYSLWCTTECYLVDIIGTAYEVVDRQYVAGDLVKINDDLNTAKLGELVIEEDNFNEIKDLIKSITD
jgi:cell division septal protein FtsQ